MNAIPTVTKNLLIINVLMFLGTVVEIDHGNDVVSVYANLDVSPAVGVGQTVACGDTVGAVGTTALAESGEEAHLHFAMRRGGSTVDPAEYVPET